MIAYHGAMAFKLSETDTGAWDTPEALFLDLRSRKVQGLLSHQADVLREYVKKALDFPDVALQLPTGSGKTLVGLLLAEWRRRKFRERVVYLLPDEATSEPSGSAGDDAIRHSCAAIHWEKEGFSP